MASWPRARRAVTSVLSCRQLPQYMPPAPAVMYAIRMLGSLVKSPRHTQADELEEVGGLVPIAVGTANERRAVDETTAAQDAVIRVADDFQVLDVLDRLADVVRGIRL